MLSGRKIAWERPKIPQPGRPCGQDFIPSPGKDRRVLLVMSGPRPPTPAISEQSLWVPYWFQAVKADFLGQPPHDSLVLAKQEK